MSILLENQFKRVAPLGFILILMTLSGCVTYPIAKNLQDQAQPVALSAVTKNPDASEGKLVIWGGKIIKTVNDTNSSSIYVLALPLDRSGRPVEYANVAGRFIANSGEFLDPEVYKDGRLVTIAGAVAGLKSEAVQKANYAYPLLDIKQIHLWPVEQHYYDPDGYPDGYYWDGYYPYWWYGGWYPGWGWNWGWYYHRGWDWDRAYHYRGGGWDRNSGGHWGGDYHYQRGSGGGDNHYQGGNQGGGGHWHR